MASVHQETEPIEALQIQDEVAGTKAISLAITLCGTTLSLFLIGIYLKRRFLKPCSLPGPNVNALAFYFTGLKAVYCQCPKTIPIWCVIFQGICGFCKVFEPQRIFRGYLFFKPIVVFFKPETVETVLSSTTLLDKAKQYSFLHPWIGTGLLTSSGEKWRKRRKLLTPTFHFSILDDFMPIFNEQTNILVSKLQTLTKESWVDVVPVMTTVSLGIICQTAMGIRLNKKQDGCSEYVKAVNELGLAFMHRVVRPYLYPDIIFNLTSYGRKYNANLRHVQGFTRKVIKEKKADILKSQSFNSAEENADSIQVKKRRVFLELLLEQHLKDPSFTEEDIREEVDTFMLEGHDTTSIALSWTLYFVGLDQEVQKKVHDELDDIFGHDIDREITREDLSQMKYLECVIKETLRFYPSVPFFGREANESFKVLDYTVQKGSALLILAYALHMDKESFPEPERFIPERFFPENSVGRHNYAYIPFSAGARNCIGQRFALMVLKTVLAHVLRRYQVTSLDPRDKMNVIPLFVIRNVEPIRIRFTARK